MKWLTRLHTAALVLIVTLLPANAFLVTWLGTTIGPLLMWKSWKELLLILLLPCTVWLLLRRPTIAKMLWHRWINRLILAYVALHALLAAVSPAGLNAVLAGLAMNLRFLAVFVLAQIVVASSDSLAARLRAWAPWWLAGAAVVVSLLAITQVAWVPKDFLSQFGYDKNQTIAPFVLVDENPDAVRAFATLNGPNDLGAFLLLPLAVIAGMLFADRRRMIIWAALLAVTLALVLTGSRSAWLGAFITLACMVVTLLPRARLLTAIRWGAIPAIVVGVIMLWLAVTVPALRLAVFHSSPGDPSLFEGSTEEHWKATARGAQSALAHPLGQGVGVAGPASFYAAQPVIPENYFVQLAIEIGIPGLALFVLICLVVARHFWRSSSLLPRALLASLAGLTVVNLLLHGWADDSVAMTWWAVAGLVYGHKELRQ